MSYQPTFARIIEERLTASGGPHTFTGLTPGQLVYARVTARNAISDLAGRQGGAWSPAGSVRVMSGVRIATSTSVLKDSAIYIEVNGELKAASIYIATEETHLYGLK